MIIVTMGRLDNDHDTNDLSSLCKFNKRECDIPDPSTLSTTGCWPYRIDYIPLPKVSKD